VSHSLLRPWALASLSVVLVTACGPSEPPKDPPLVADPPLASSGGPVPDDGAVQTEMERGMAYAKAERWAEAKEHFEKAIAVKPSALAYAELGVAYEKTGDKPGAEKAYKQALSIDPGMSDAATNLAALYLDEPPRPDEAIAVLKAAIAKAPDPRLYQNLGYALGLKGDVEGASKAYEAGLAKAEDARMRFDYGAFLLEHKQAERAAEHLKKALDGTKDDAGLLGELGSMLGKVKAYPECVRAFDRALKIKASEVAWLINRGICKHQVDDEPGAQADFEGAIKADAKSAAAHYYLGVSYLSQKNKLKAIVHLEQAAKLGAGKPIGKEAQAKFDELTKKVKGGK
jgi:Tfp pilus assembly protein PilF